MGTVPAVIAFQTGHSSHTATLLSELIQVKTSNPPGNERKLDELLLSKFKPLGFEVEIIATPDPAKAHCIARLRANRSQAHLLAAHADVVGAATSAAAAPYAALAAHTGPSLTDTTLFAALTRAANRVWPKAPVAPYLFQAGTDAAAWRSRGVPVYGIYPCPVTNDDLSRMHGKDKRLSVKSLDEGTEMIYETPLEVVSH